MTKSNLKKSREGLSAEESKVLLKLLKDRFEKNKSRHPAMEWSNVEE